MQRGDGGLDLERAGQPAGHGAVEQRQPARDGGLIPQRPVLRFERHDIALRVKPRAAAGMGQQHQRKQPFDLGLVPVSGD